MTRRDWTAGLLGGFFTGIASGFFGVGGGLVLIPVLTQHFHATQHQAHGTSLAVIGAAAVVSVAVYALQGSVSWPIAIGIGLASVLTSRWGARLAKRTSARGLRRAFAVFLVLVALRLWIGAASVAAAPRALEGPALVAVIVALGLAVGLLAGYMGVGGGILIVPALALLLGWPQHLAQGTSLAAILLVAPLGSIEHARLGHVLGRIVPMLAIGAAIGGPLASAWAHGLDRTVLQRCFAVFLLANAVLTWMREDKPPPAR